MASLFSTFNNTHGMKYYGAAALSTERNQMVDCYIIAKGNIIEGIEAKE